MTTRRSLFTVVAAAVAWLLPASRASVAKSELGGEWATMLSFSCEGGEHQLCSFHPRGTDKVRVSALPVGDHIAALTGSGQIVVAFPTGAATVSRAGKRITIDFT